MCVLPSTRGGINLARCLKQAAGNIGGSLRLPRITTVGDLAEHLYQAPQPIALELEQTLAWARALRSIAPDNLKPLFPIVPEPEPLGPWVDISGMLRRLHEELAAHGYSFDDVAPVTETATERRRWELLSTIHQRYLSELAAANLCDPHVARQQAISQGKCTSNQSIVLIGTSDLSNAITQMLQSLPSPVLALVAAPQHQSERFDDFGCIRTDSWIDHHLPIQDHHFVTAGDISDQTRAVAESIDLFRKSFANCDITVGVTDESQVGPVEVELRSVGIPCYRHLGWTLAETAVGRLMNLITVHLRRQTWQTLAALVRHADVCAMVSRQLECEPTTWLTTLDNLLADHFPIPIEDPLPAGVHERHALAVDIARRIQSWLGDFTKPEQTISQWSQTLDHCLEPLYADRLAAAGIDRTTKGVAKAREVLHRFAELNSHLDMSISGVAAVEMLASRLSEVRFGDELTTEDVEIAGWLDLSLDDSAALVVVGFNHPFVPSAVTSDPFLPGSLRTKLRLADNERRYARDVYAAHLMLTTRTQVRFIVGRTSADGSPTPPSRLLAAAPSSDSARRVLLLLDAKRPPVKLDDRWSLGPKTTRLPIPALDASKGAQVSELSVTAFQLYLTCPYRFFLRYIEKIKPLSDDGSELAANQFGDLIHNTLDLFGRDPSQRDEADAAKIQQYLMDHLHHYAAQRYGTSANSSVALQVAQAERRLKVVAERQAERVADGWRIQHVEKSAGKDQGSGIEVDGRWMTLNGRFDRIDFQPRTGRWAILDYKTHGELPAKKHLKKTDSGYQWLELQLPLYRMMAPFLQIPVDPMEVELGYFNISQKDAETRINIAAFGEDLMSHAKELIHQTIRNIWNGKFEPTDKPVVYDDYWMILQTGIADKLLAGVGVEDE